MKTLRQYIRFVLYEIAERDDEKGDEKEDNLLLEPDEAKETDKAKQEVNAISTGGGSMQSAGTIRGVTTPLGTGPTYPVGRRKKRKKAKKGSSDWYKN